MERKEETDLSTFNDVVRRLRSGEGPGKSPEAECWGRAGRGCPPGARQTQQERRLRRSGGGMRLGCARTRKEPQSPPADE